MARRRKQPRGNSNQLDLQCPVCYDDVMTDPTVLDPCGHMFCAKCLSAREKYRGFSGPKCMLCSTAIKGTVVPIVLRNFAATKTITQHKHIVSPSPPLPQPQHETAAEILFLIWEANMHLHFPLFVCCFVLVVLGVKGGGGGGQGIPLDLVHEFLKAVIDVTNYMLAIPMYMLLDAVFCFNSTIPCLFFNGTVLGNAMHHAHDLSTQVMAAAFPAAAPQ